MALISLSPGVSPLPVDRIVPKFRGRNVQLRICSGVKGLEKDGVASKTVGKGYKIPNYEDGVVAWLYGQVKQVETTSLTKNEDEEEEAKKRDYYVNTGYAIRMLREEFPELFYRELSFGIYRDDIVFKDPVNTFAGIDNYKSIFWALRFHGKIFFRALWVDIISVWQPVENMIIVRWTVHGVPRVPWDSRSRFDGTSEYKLDKDGKIYEHKVHNIAVNGPQKFKVLDVEKLLESIGCPSTPKPTYFELSSSWIEISASAAKRWLSSSSVLARPTESKMES